MRNFIINVDHIPGQNNGFLFYFNWKAFTIFLLPEGQLCFWNFSFLAESGPYISAGFKKQSVLRAISVSTNYILTFSQKRENRPCSFFKTRVRYLSRFKYWKETSIRFVFWRRTSLPFFVCNHTSTSGNFICLSCHGKILAESFQFDWKENIFYKLEKYIQPDCMTTNRPLSKCHDRDKR